jgi:dienelactone hydrolase
MNDTFAALAILAKHPRIDPVKIAVMGFSKGCHTLALREHEPFPERLRP